MTAARSIRVSGVVQGVGFRPFVYRLARANALAGWVSNEESGVAIHLEGHEPGVQAFLRDLAGQPPPAALITAIDVFEAQPAGLTSFTIRPTQVRAPPTVPISPDMPVCDDCLREMHDATDPRYQYPYINCTNCGPRYSLIQRLPYDRGNTTMTAWPMDGLCAAQYGDPGDRRFHAQPVACPNCGPGYVLADCVVERDSGGAAPGGRAETSGPIPPRGWPAIRAAASRLRAGELVAIKGIGGYHVACDARNPGAIERLRERKFRKEKPFALMARTLDIARQIVELSSEAEALLLSSPRPIVLAPKITELPGIAPDNDEYGLMLPYAPPHHLLFDAGAPDLLVMTSGNRSSEPIAYRDEEAVARLSGIADVFLAGERPIARRVDDSVARSGPFGPAILRRSRGYAPGAVTLLPPKRPLLALGADLKNTITVVVDGQAFMSQHIGDLNHYESQQAFRQTIDDLMSMYGIDPAEVLVAHDAHPEYFSTSMGGVGACRRPIQHHRAHIASVLAERQAWREGVIGISFDGTGYGDDGAIWGGEFFAGSIAEGLRRVLHLRPAALPGGDAAARFPVQAAAGFLSQLDPLPNLGDPPFHFPERYWRAAALVTQGVRTFPTTSIGRLFDTAAALLGFTREITFEGQAATWLEQLARRDHGTRAYPFPLVGEELDFRQLLQALIDDRLRGRDPAGIARAFHRGIALGVCHAAALLADANALDTVVLSGGVFQNQLLLEDIAAVTRLRVWTNNAVPPNDGGISLGQAALAAFQEPPYA
jgi:hydrogenase maturation protein HypF